MREPEDAVLPGARVLVTGATGFVGGHLVPGLLAAGYRVRALVRDPERYDAPEGVEVVQGDLLHPGTLIPALEGVEAAYYLVHSMDERGRGDFAARDRRAAMNFVRAAEAMDLRRIVYLGGLGETTDDLSEHLASRLEVANILESGRVPVTTLRAAVILGRGSKSFDMIRQLVERLAVMITPRWVQSKCQPIFIDDVVGYLVGVLAKPEAAGERFDVGGPDTLTYEEMMRGFARVEGLKLRMMPVPVLTPKLSSYWVDLVTSVPAAIAHPLIEGLRNDVVCRDARIRDLLPRRLVGYEEGVAKALA